MNLTSEQIASLDQGDAVPIVVDGRECVVIRREAYDQALSSEEQDVKSMHRLLVDLAPEDWEDASNYESR